MKFIISLIFVVVIGGCAGSSKSLAPDLNLALLTSLDEQEFNNSEPIRNLTEKADPYSFVVDFSSDIVERRLNACHETRYFNANKNLWNSNMHYHENPLQVFKYKNINFFLVEWGVMFGKRIEYSWKVEEVSNTSSRVSGYAWKGKTSKALKGMASGEGGTHVFSLIWECKPN